MSGWFFVLRMTRQPSLQSSVRRSIAPFTLNGQKLFNAPNRRFSTEADEIPCTVRWRKKDGSEVVTEGHEGDILLRLAQSNGIELEGACEGVCACSTCHVILEDSVFDSLPEATEKEDDMLDQAFGLTASSRLSCQIRLTSKCNNMLVKLPSATRNFYVDGHVPKPH